MISPLVPLNTFFDTLTTLKLPQQKTALETRLHQIESKKIFIEETLSQKMKRSCVHVVIPKRKTDTHNAENGLFKRALKVIKKESKILSIILSSLTKETNQEELSSLKTAVGTPKVTLEKLGSMLDRYIHSKDRDLLYDFFFQCYANSKPEGRQKLTTIST
jgi:hypothetical protein